MRFGREGRKKFHERLTAQRLDKLERDIKDMRKKADIIAKGKERRRLRFTTSRRRQVGKALFEGKQAQKRRRKRLPRVIHSFGEDKRKLKRVV